MLYFLLTLSVICASLASIVMHGAKIGKSVFTFNLIGTALWCVILFVASGFSVDFSTKNVLWGLLYGTVQALFVLFKTLSMNSGPVSATTLVGNASMPISIIVSVIFFGDKATWFDALGILILLIGIFLITYKKESGTHTRAWSFFIPFFFVFGAGVGIVFKAFSRYNSPECAGDMMFISALFMSLFYTILATASGEIKNGGTKIKNKSFILFALSTGALTCIYNRLNVFLTGALSAALFFPAFNGGVIVISATLAAVIYRERLKRRTLVGTTLGALAIVIIGIL